MRSGSGTGLGAFAVSLGVVAASGYTAACGYASIEGDPIVSNPDPSPTPDPSRDAGTASPVGPRSTIAASDAGADTTALPRAGSTTCTIPDLVLCFTFEGELADHSPAPIMPSESSNIAFGPGHEDRAAIFAADSALRFSANPAFDLTPTHGTVEAWINRTVPGDAVVFDDDARLSLTIDANGKLWCKSSGGAALGTNVVPTGTWVHVACVIDGATLTADLNGAIEASGAGSIIPAPTATAIGGNAPSGEPFIGSIDSLRVLKASRTAAQIAADAQP